MQTSYTFRYSFFERAWICVWGLVMAILWFAFASVMIKSLPQYLGTFLFLAGLGFFSLGLVASAFVRKLTLENDTVTSTIFLFGTVTLHANEIDSVRSLTSYGINLWIRPKDGVKKRGFGINSHFQDIYPLLVWLNERFPNPEVKKLVAEREEILSEHPELVTDDAKENLFRKYNQQVGVLITFCFLLLLWSFAPVDFYREILLGFLILLPWALLFWVKFSKGAIRVYSQVNSNLTRISACFTTLAFSVLYFAQKHYNLVNQTQTILPSAAFCLLLFAGFNFCAHEIRKNLYAQALMFLVCAMYGYGTAVCLNVELDYFNPTDYQSMVIAKTEGGRRNPSLYLELAPWNGSSAPVRADVPFATYEKFSKGSAVQISQEEGRFGIAWFEVQSPSK